MTENAVTSGQGFGIADSFEGEIGIAIVAANKPDPNRIKSVVRTIRGARGAGRRAFGGSADMPGNVCWLMASVSIVNSSTCSGFIIVSSPRGVSECSDIVS